MMADMWNDDISFCQDFKCKRKSCKRNMANIQDRSIPHSFFVDTPPDCQKNKDKSVDQEDVADIMNAINDAIENIGYEAVGYDNSGIFLNIIIGRRI